MITLKVCLGIVFSAVCFSKCLQATEGIEENKKFHREAAKSPVYLKKISDIIVKNYSLNIKRPGFKIFEFDTHKEVGYVTTQYNSNEKYIEINWVFIDEAFRKKGYATHALQTLESIYKARKECFPEAEDLWLSVSDNNTAMLRVCEKLGYIKSENIGYFINLKKQIPYNIKTN